MLTSLTEYIAGVDGRHTEDELEEGAEEQNTIEEELSSLAIAMAAMDRCGKMSSELRNSFIDVQRDPSLQKQAMPRQTTILEHFKKQ